MRAGIVLCGQKNQAPAVACACRMCMSCVVCSQVGPGADFAGVAVFGLLKSFNMATAPLVRTDRGMKAEPQDPSALAKTQQDARRSHLCTWRLHRDSLVHFRAFCSL